jgi:hypothetical protein
VSSIDLGSCWRRETLHAIVTGTEQHRAKYIDGHMKAHVCLSRMAARGFIQRALALKCWVFRDGHYEEDGVDKKHDSD